MVEAGQSHPFEMARPLSVGLSLAVHAIALVVLVLLAAPRVLKAPATPVMAVDIVSPEQYARLQMPLPAAPESIAVAAEPSTAAAPSAAAPQAQRSVPPTIAPAGQMIHATAFYAASILADPANAEVHRNFGELASSEQLIQLCNIEALEQLGRGLAGIKPDAVVGYAFGDLEVDGDTLVADGGAYRRQGQWFKLRFECAARPDMSGIAAFDYVLGEAIPQSQWEGHFLNADDEGLAR